MRIKSLFTLFMLVVLLPGAALSLSGCGGGSSEPVAQEPIAANSLEPVVDTPDVAEAAADKVSAPAVLEEETAPTVEPVVEAPVEQAILTWARDAGGLSHCDRLSVYEDGRVEAVVCQARTSQPMIYGTLSAEQLAQVVAWTAEYALFSRREMGVSSAVSTTVLQGSGTGVPEPQVKVEVASFASNLFFVLTGTK
jgi:hypothetical protein